MVLSVVIPVYKVEQYIRHTLSSIFGQQFDEALFEVVVVDDGTPDQSMSIVEEFAAQHANIRMLHQENQGLSGARNIGLSAAQGEYIWWVDSDDSLTDDSLSYVYQQVQQYSGCDIFGFGIYTVDEATGQRRQFSPLSKYCGSSPYGRVVDYSSMGNHTFGPVSRYVFRRDFLMQSHLQFWQGILHEDVDFLNKAFFCAQQVVLTEQPVYCYLERSSGSIMSSVKMKSFTDLLAITRSFLQVRSAHLSDVKARLYWDGVLWRMVTIILRPDMRGHGLSPEAWPEYCSFVSAHASLFRRLAIRSLKPSWLGSDWKDLVFALMVLVHPQWLSNWNRSRSR